MNARRKLLRSAHEAVTVLLLMSLLQCCNEEDVHDQSTAGSTFVTQADLDAATIVNRASDILIIGNPFQQREAEARNNFRDIVTNYPITQGIQPGDLIVIRNFTNLEGRRGSLLFFDVMIKREAGYNPRGGDFEYIRIPFDSTTNYMRHPNGLLPDLVNVKLRGDGTNIKNVNCVTCHNLTSDFIFSN